MTDFVINIRGQSDIVEEKMNKKMVGFVRKNAIRNVFKVFQNTRTNFFHTE